LQKNQRPKIIKNGGGAIFLVALFLLWVTTTSAVTTISVTNPLGGTCNDLVCILDKVAGALWWIGSPLAVMMVIWGAIQILTSAGNAERVKTGKHTILYAVVGIIFLLLAGGLNLIIQSLFA